MNAFDRAQEAYDNRSEPVNNNYEYVEGLAYQALNHDYLELIVMGIDSKPLCEFQCFEHHINEILVDAMLSKVDGIRHAAQVVIRHGLETDLNEVEFTGYQATKMRSQLYLAAEIKKQFDGEVFGQDLLLLACHKYASADKRINYQLIQFWQDIYGEL